MGIDARTAHPGDMRMTSAHESGVNSKNLVKDNIGIASKNWDYHARPRETYVQEGANNFACTMETLVLSVMNDNCRGCVSNFNDRNGEYSPVCDSNTKNHILLPISIA